MGIVYKKHRQGKRHGSSMVELTLVAPFVALFMVVAIRFAALFNQAIDNVSNADAAASERTLRWEIANVGSGFQRPCLEELAERYGNAVRVEGGGISIGFGDERQEILIPQEVHIVAGNICQNW